MNVDTGGKLSFHCSSSRKASVFRACRTSRQHQDAEPAHAQLHRDQRRFSTLLILLLLHLSASRDMRRYVRSGHRSTEVLDRTRNNIVLVFSVVVSIRYLGTSVSIPSRQLALALALAVTKRGESLRTSSPTILQPHTIHKREGPPASDLTGRDSNPSPRP